MAQIECWEGDGITPQFVLDRRKRARELVEHHRSRRDVEARVRRWDREGCVEINQNGYSSMYLLGCLRHDLKFPSPNRCIITAYGAKSILGWWDERLISVGTLFVRTPGLGDDTPMRLPVCNAFRRVAIINRSVENLIEPFLKDSLPYDAEKVTLEIAYQHREGGHKLDEMLRARRDIKDHDCSYFSPEVVTCGPCQGDGHYNCEHCASYQEEPDT